MKSHALCPLAFLAAHALLLLLLLLPAPSSRTGARVVPPAFSESFRNHALRRRAVKCRTGDAAQDGARLSHEEISRYSRHLILPQVGMAGQLALKQASVLCVGAGES